MIMRHLFSSRSWGARIALLALLMTMLPSCGNDAVAVSDDGIPEGWPRPQYETAEIQFGGETITVEIADTPDRRAYGFMFVREVKDGHGMIFIYPDNRPEMSFWMRNTRVPLDLLYLRDDGGIVNIHQDMKPLQDQPGYPSAGPCRLVLELPGGWVAEHGVWMRHKVALPPEILEREAEDDVFGRANIPDVLGSG